MSLLKSLRSLVIEDSTEEPKEVAKAEQARPAPSVPSVPAGEPAQWFTTMGESETVVPPTLDTKSLASALQAQILGSPGFDSAARFLVAVDSIKDIIPEESLRFKTARATTGLNPSAIVESLQSAGTVLNAEVYTFENNFVAALESDIADTNKRVDALDLKIHEMTAQLGSLSAQKVDLVAEATAKKVDLDKAKIDFNSVIATVGSKYSELAKRVTQHLGA